MIRLNKKNNKIIKAKEWNHAPDRALIIIILIILAFGLISLSSASAVVAYSKFHDAYYYFKHQIFGIVIGLVAFLFFSKTNYHVWKKYSFGFLIFSIFLLLLVFIPGLAANYGTSRSWINVFGYSVQPSEFVKLSFLLYLAAWLESRKGALHDINDGMAPFVVTLGIIGGLMLMQPDIGTLSIIVATSLIVYFVGGGNYKHIATFIIFGFLVLAISIYFKPYQFNRFKCAFDSNFSTNDICYQTNQSLIAVGSGGFFGRGLGESRQKFMYLPEVSGDSIFAIIGEEVGMLFGSFLILCFVFLFYRGYLISKNAPDDFGKILAIGIVSWLVIQTFTNIGGTVNIMPMTGVPLPLVSYGGTAVLAALSALGILVNISKYTK